MPAMTKEQLATKIAELEKQHAAMPSGDIGQSNARQSIWLWLYDLKQDYKRLP